MANSVFLVLLLIQSPISEIDLTLSRETQKSRHAWIIVNCVLNVNTGTNNIGSKISADLLEDSDEVGQPSNQVFLFQSYKILFLKELLK